MSTAWDPQLLALVQAQKQSVPHGKRYEMPFAQARAALLHERRAMQTGLPPMASVEDETLELPQRRVALRHFRPVGAADDAHVIYLHGGGWCVGSNETHETVLRHLAAAAGVTVCGVDYALAPEHPFPAALHEVQAVVETLSRRGAIVLAGDSAGANLALAEAMRQRDLRPGQPPALAGLVLFYGVYGPEQAGGSHAAYGSGDFGLSLAAQRRYLDTYLNGTPPNWRVFPLMGRLQGLPPVHLLAAELDLLRDDSHRLQEALRHAGGVSTLRVRQGVPHGFLSYADRFEGARAELEEAGCFVRACLGR